MIMENSLSIIAAFILSLLFIIALTPIAHKIGLVDAPNHRKVHKGSIPLIGGIAIFMATATAQLISIHETPITAYLIVSALLVIVGSVDDYLDVKVRYRIIAQLLIASILVLAGEHYLENLGKIVFVGEVHLGWFKSIFSIFAIMVAINAFNFIDGIDGLAGSLGANALLSISILAYIANGNQPTAGVVFPLILTSALIPFLFSNLGKLGSNLKTFLGDAGSMFIGLTIVWLLVTHTQDETKVFAPVTALWIIAIPLMDMLAIFIRRVRKGQLPFQADRNHLHHVFMRAGFSDREALIVIIFCAVLFSVIGIAGELMQIPEQLMLIAYLLLFVGYYQIVNLMEVGRIARKATIEKHET